MTISDHYYQGNLSFMTYRVNAGEWHDSCLGDGVARHGYDDDPNTLIPRGSA